MLPVQKQRKGALLGKICLCGEKFHWCHVATTCCYYILYHYYENKPDHQFISIIIIISSSSSSSNIIVLLFFTAPSLWINTTIFLFIVTILICIFHKRDSCFRLLNERQENKTNNNSSQLKSG